MKKTKLSKQKLAYYKKILLENKARILGDVEHLENGSLHNSQRDSSGDISGWSTHMADAGTDAAERETMLKLAATEQELVEKINHALKRLEEKGLVKFKFDKKNPRIRKLTYPIECWKLLPRFFKIELKKLLKV